MNSIVNLEKTFDSLIRCYFWREVKILIIKLTSGGIVESYLNIFLNNLMKIKMFKKIFRLIESPNIYKLTNFCEELNLQIQKRAFFKTFILYERKVVEKMKKINISKISFLTSILVAKITMMNFAKSSI